MTPEIVRMGSGPLRYGARYVVKIDGQTVGTLTYEGRRGGLNIWRVSHLPADGRSFNYSGPLADAARCFA